MKKADRIRNMLRKKLRSSFLWGSVSFLMGSHIYGARYLLECDITAILRYDSMRRKSPDFVPLPSLYTENGRKVLKKLLKAYEDDRPVSDIEYQNKLLDAGGWLCPCGRANPSYTFVCACKNNKQNALPKEALARDRRPHWYCFCGKENLPHITTCVCGRKKQEVPMSQRYPSAKNSSWLCPCGRTNPNYTSTCVCGKNKRDITQI